MKASRKSSSNDKKKLLAIPLLAVIFIGVLAGTDWSVLGDSEESGTQQISTANVSANPSSEKTSDTKDAVKDSPKTIVKTGASGSGKSNKIVDWSKPPSQTTEDLQTMELEEILLYDPFQGNPTVLVSTNTTSAQSSSGSVKGESDKPDEEVALETLSVSAIYVENGKAYAMIKGKVVPVDGHEQLIRRLNRRSLSDQPYSN